MVVSEVLVGQLERLQHQKQFRPSRFEQGTLGNEAACAHHDSPLLIQVRRHGQLRYCTGSDNFQSVLGTSLPGLTDIRRGITVFHLLVLHGSLLVCLR